MPVFNQSRSRVIRILFVLTIGILLLQLFILQVLTGKYRRMAMDQAVSANIIYPERGIVYDRKGKPLVNNIIMYDLMVTPAEIKDFDTLGFCQLMELDTAIFKKRILEAIIKNTKVRPSVFESLLSDQQKARFEENSWRFSGFAIVARPIRKYPFNAAAHALGYIAEVDTGDIRRSNNFYRQGDYIGQSGLEAYYEKILMGQRGVKYMIKDNKNRLVNSYENGSYDTVAVAGRGLKTYMDGELQQLAEKLLANKVGSIVAIEPKTGGILAMASGPHYDPNDLKGATYKKTYATLESNASKPLLNRAIQGGYPAGSTYKPLGALIALDEGVITPQSGYGCGGAYYACKRPVNCTEKWGGHAANMRLAIATSCNSFFCNTFRLTVDNPRIGNNRKGLERWKEYCNDFGYGHKLGIDLAGEKGGNIPDTNKFNRLYNYNWNSCTMVTMGIGQDEMLCTPLQMANGICVVANKGSYFIPHIVKNIEAETKEDTLLNKYRTKHTPFTHIPDSTWNAVIEGMHMVTTRGTAARLKKIPGINICAKTGTAQAPPKYGVPQKDHSLFVCFAPMENPKIVVATIIENGGFGATWAGPISYLLLEKYLTDSLRPEQQKDVERIHNANLMPKYLVKEQYMMDTSRAYWWFRRTHDSSYIKKYLGPSFSEIIKNKKDSLALAEVKKNAPSANDKKDKKSKLPQSKDTTFFIKEEETEVKPILALA